MDKENSTNEENGVRHQLLVGSRKLFLAGLGAVMMTQDELGHMAERLVKRGEPAHEKGRKSVDEFFADRRKRTKKAGERVEKEFDARVESLLHRMNIPTRSDITSLSTKITRLSKKVDKLK